MGVGTMSRLCEDIRDAVDISGSSECYRDAVEKFHKKTGLPLDGLWSVVNSVIDGHAPEKVLKRLHKSWGGSPSDWAKWYAMAQKRPNC